MGRQDWRHGGGARRRARCRARDLRGAASLRASALRVERALHAGRQPRSADLFIPFEEIVDVSDVKLRVYLKRYFREINALGWTRDPRKPGSVAAPYFPKPPSAAAVKPDANGGVPPRALVESGDWSPGEAAPRSEPGKRYRIGDRFKPGDSIPVEGQYTCTVCGFRKHSRQFREENPEGRFPPPHHPGALWELEDLRP